MKYVLPSRIVAKSGAIENEQVLLEEHTLQIGLQERNTAKLEGKSWIILDFGKEVSGGVRILTYAISGSKAVRLRFGESVAETCAELGYKGACNDHSPRDMTVELQWYSDLSFGQTGFRFLRIDGLSENTVLQVKAIVAAVDTDEREEIGSFICNDSMLNNIWETASYTLRLCMQNGYFWDGVKRDRLVWIGDLYPEMRAAHCLFGSVAETLNSVDFAWAESAHLTWIANSPTYSLWWLIILCDEYLYSGAKEPFTKYLPRIHDLLQTIDARVAEDGTTSFEGHFIDWPTNYRAGEPIEKQLDSLVGTEYLAEIAVKKTQAFLAAYSKDVEVCKSILTKLAKGTRNVTKYKQIAGLGVWSGDRSGNNKNILIADGANGMSTFMSYPILTALAELGEEDVAMSALRHYYGGMLALGATTFWEDFDIAWLENASRIDELPQDGKNDVHGDNGRYCYKGYRHSLCHGWSAGVIPYLIETVVGVKTMGAGMRTIRVCPKLSGLAYVKASIPTPYGVMTVEHKLLNNGELKTHIEKPDEISIV